jgi:hypothetical protein
MGFQEFNIIYRLNRCLILPQTFFFFQIWPRIHRSLVEDLQKCDGNCGLGTNRANDLFNLKFGPSFEWLPSYQEM